MVDKAGRRMLVGGLGQSLKRNGSKFAVTSIDRYCQPSGRPV